MNVIISPNNFPIEQNMSCTSEKKKRQRGRGHMTGPLVWNGGVHSCTGATIISARSSDLAKLNPIR